MKVLGWVVRIGWGGATKAASYKGVKTGVELCWVVTVQWWGEERAGLYFFIFHFSLNKGNLKYQVFKYKGMLYANKNIKITQFLKVVTLFIVSPLF